MIDEIGVVDLYICVVCLYVSRVGWRDVESSFFVGLTDHRIEWRLTWIDLASWDSPFLSLELVLCPLEQ